MDAKTQIIALCLSFVYGFILYFLTKLNNSIIKNKKKIYRSLITILYTYNLILIYIILIFHINNGTFHLYFFLMIIIGYIMAFKFTNKMLNNVKFCSFLAKLKKKCYTKTK